MSAEAGRYRLTRRGVLMEPDPDNASEAWGVLNPGSARTRDGRLLLYPRAVSEGNFSRIEIVEVRDIDGGQASVARRGVALAPLTVYEHDQRAHGGVEDPRVTFIDRLGHYVMAYVALGRLGPRVAMAISEDGWSWQRLGLLRFSPDVGVDFRHYGNKDACIFPDVVKDPRGEEAFAILHRPTYLMHYADGTVHRVLPPGRQDDRGSIWISYISARSAQRDIAHLTASHETALLAAPKQEWEALKIGAGTPPILTKDGWLLYYHGVSGREPEVNEQRKDVCYQAGAMLLDRHDPRMILYRSPRPVLSPQHHSERMGIVPNVVFPTAVDVQGRSLSVFYGAADTRIALATGRLESDVLIAPSSPPETKT